MTIRSRFKPYRRQENLKLQAPIDPDITASLWREAQVRGLINEEGAAAVSAAAARRVSHAEAHRQLFLDLARQDAVVAAQRQLAISTTGASGAGMHREQRHVVTRVSITVFVVLVVLVGIGLCPLFMKGGPTGLLVAAGSAIPIIVAGISAAMTIRRLRRDHQRVRSWPVVAWFMHSEVKPGRDPAAGDQPSDRHGPGAAAGTRR